MGGVAVVTGAGSGVGAAVAGALLAAGWRVACLGRRVDALEATIAGASVDATIAGAPADAAIAIGCDVADEDAVEAAFDAAVARWGRIDLLFNNAGRNIAAATIDAMAVADWRSVIDVNLTGSFLCARAAFARMRAQSPRGGRIINNGSVSAQAPRPRSAAYTASKHAITGLTKSLALDGRPYDIACGQIDIGNALTEMASGIARGAAQADGSVAPEPTIDPENVARAVVMMASLPLGANVPFITVMATNMPLVGRG